MSPEGVRTGLTLEGGQLDKLQGVETRVVGTGML